MLMPSDKEYESALRLPPITAELVLVSIDLQLERERFGMRHCKERGIGRRRRKLGHAPLYFAPPLGELERIPQQAVEIARDGARTLLAEMCRECPFSRCGMKAW